MFQFEWLWAWAFLPLPLLVYFLLPQVERQEAALKVPFFSQVRALQHQATGTPAHQHKISAGWLAFIWVLLVTATARPQWVGEPITLPATGRDLLLAVDISGSMKTPDMVVQDKQIARILVVKYVVNEFIERRESDRLGLILFGSQAYLQAPLTFDRKTVSTLLDEAQLGFAGEQTAIGDAVGLAIKRLRERPASQRVLILLTDGANTAGEVAPRQAADLAKQAGIKIYTVGVGADQMEQRMGLFGGFSRTVNPSSDLDEDTLRYMAETTGGLYFRARNPQELQAIYEELDKLEPIEQDGEILRPISALFMWPLLAAILLSAVYAVWRLYPLGTRFTSGTSGSLEGTR
ncbi:vWA domain-containing protein [Teredinibacter turnerae]|uniref:vWA domain-containing protein n=1 Tax=Teredinibacter turnerae TaxID=2426 RepID=UPI0005F7E34E|nr:VWA domain-containing protein [Teredinibacter turnerae]